MTKNIRINIFKTGVLFLLTFFSLAVFSIEADIRQSPYQLYSNVEQSLTSLLPELKEQLENLSKKLTNKNEASSFRSIQSNITKLKSISNQIQSEQNFKQIASSIEKIRATTDRASQLAKENKIAEAKQELKKSIIYTKILSESSVLKMSEAQIDLDEANQRIEKKDYIAAGLFLEKSLAHLGEINMQNHRLDDEIAQIKNDISITHKQILLGKYKDNLAKKSVWKRMRQTQVDSVSHYYDLWSKNSRPGEID